MSILVVGDFEAGNLRGWGEQRFKGRTKYSLTTTEGRRVLAAASSRSASGLLKRIRVDLTKTPFFNWSWRVDNILSGINEKTKSGDDYPARVYVVFSHEIFFWKTQSITYVWSSHQPVNTSWPSAVTSNSRMVAVQSGAKNLGRWVAQKRNVREDYKTFFGGDQRVADGVALMTDTDNSGQSATAYYGNIFFSSE